MKYPKTIGACIDLAFEIRAERQEKSRAYDAEIGEMKANEKLLEDHILNSFSKSDIDGAKGKIATAAIKRSTVGKITDWPTLCKYVKENDAWDLLYKRITNEAYNARLEVGEAVPGTEPFQKMDLSLTKIGK